MPPASHTEGETVKYVGIDVQLNLCQVVVLDGNGELLDETQFMNTPECIEDFT